MPCDTPPGATWLGENLEGPVERENPEAKIKSQHPQPPPIICSLGHLLW